MSDVVVTVPKPLWLDWIAEGDAVDEPRSGIEWGFFLGGPKPAIARGERVYIVSHGRLRGYSPLTRLADTDRGYALCREGGAVAVTIPDRIPGFRGWRKRWWDRAVEVPFPDWRLCDVEMRRRPTGERSTAAAEVAEQASANTKQPLLFDEKPSSLSRHDNR